MSTYSFRQAVENTEAAFVLRPGCSNEVRGIWSDIRIDRRTLPTGWYAYDFRQSDIGKIFTLEKHSVTKDYAGTLLTNKPVQFPRGKNHLCLCGCGGYTFAPPRILTTRTKVRRTITGRKIELGDVWYG